MNIPKDIEKCLRTYLYHIIYFDDTEVSQKISETKLKEILLEFSREDISVMLYAFLWVEKNPNADLSTVFPGSPTNGTRIVAYVKEFLIAMRMYTEFEKI